MAAVAIGASVIERHITLDKTMKGGDHAASLNPIEFKQLVLDIRTIEKAMGSSTKMIQHSEESCIPKLTKSIVSAVDIQKNCVITCEMLIMKGPGIGISPMMYDDIVGRVTKRNIEAVTGVNLILKI